MRITLSGRMMARSIHWMGTPATVLRPLAAMNLMPRMLAAMALCVLSALCHVAHAGTLDARAAHRLIDIDREIESHGEKMLKIRSTFDEFLPDYQELLRGLPAATPGQLKALWELAGFMAYATNEIQFSQAMMSVHDEYERRSIVAPLELRQRLLTSLIAARRFDEAQSYAVKAGIPIEHIPRVEGQALESAGQLAILRVDSAQAVLRRENLKLDDEVHVFVVSFIGCAFSRRAADAIEKHEVLSHFMRKRSTWIVMPGNLYFTEVLAWNRAHPSTGFAYLMDQAPWDFIDDWSTPTFYFVRQGRVVSKVKGWADDAAGISALLDAMNASSQADRVALRK